MDSKPGLTAEHREQLAKLMSFASDMLFEASTSAVGARRNLRALAHTLGQLYGETIRQCKGYDGLQDEVTNTFMTGMALEPNFGREEEREYKRREKLPADQRKALLEGSWKDEPADENV